MNRASTTETAASSAQDTSVRTFCSPCRGAVCAADIFFVKLDIKKPPILSMGGGLVIWTFKQERNCCTISVCYSGCEMTPRRDSFARRQPPIQPVLDASFLLMQRSGTHALCVKLTGSHLPVLPVLLRAYCIVYGGKNQAEINIFLLILAIFSCLSRNVENAASNLLSIIQLSLQISRLYLTS